MGLPRSRRLRKKLHRGEFKELGFDVDFSFREGLSEEEIDRFFDDLIGELIVPANLIYGGATEGFVCRATPGSVTEEERAGVLKWLEARPELTRVEIGPLVDAWYSGTDSMLL
ncbi:MAG: YggL family protein [Rhodocyclaceae bacterium]|nr:YggL family protein [Rhodocyclaceae bacterium]MCB1902339.1 YggL family protein [Rhodocyclaceae bacterium]MCP5307945.1 YggL family protein [Zoogloeaceae bacterium]